jgi:hypothetical protein
MRGEDMPEIRNVGQEVQAEILKTARKGQEAVVGAIKTWTGTVRSITPPLKELRLPFGDRLPFADRLPKPEEVAGNAYEFAQKLLASQRKFAEGVLHAAAPLLPGNSDTAKNGDTARNGDTAQNSVPAKNSGPGRKNNGSTAK